ncbi:phasin family protein [Sphingomonas sp. IC-56]|uniref:phasin family protein n=1 Tax=Sphingomonas sp. IC-56 TaxID=2898529 RepID=UPI001E4D63D0|nr:phasin family protein [Sphingomonas sp. IC-56]MCD2325188.1 phasin family protein [Sphingomonas sp. IC-56]
MATKGPKAGKPAVRTTQPSALVAEAVAATVEKAEPVSLIEAGAPINQSGPVPSVEAASQEVETQAAEAPAQAAAAHIVNESASASEATRESIVKEVSTMETTIENGAKAQALFNDFNDRARAAVEKSTKLAEEAGDFAKGNLEALVESSRIAAKGLESFGQDAADYGRRSFENATSAMKTLSTIKSPTDFFKFQSDFVRGVFDAYVAETSKNTEAMIKLASDAAQPLSNRVAVAVEKVKTAA